MSVIFSDIAKDLGDDKKGRSLRLTSFWTEPLADGVSLPSARKGCMKRWRCALRRGVKL